MKPKKGDQEFEAFCIKLFDRRENIEIIESPTVTNAGDAIVVKAFQSLLMGADAVNVLRAIFSTGFHIGYEVADDWNEYKGREKKVVH